MWKSWVGETQLSPLGGCRGDLWRCESVEVWGWREWSCKIYMFVGFQHIWRKCCLVRTFCVPVCCVCKAGGDLCSPSLGPCMFITISAIQRVQNKRDLLWCTPTLQRLKHIYRAKSLLHTILVFSKTWSRTRYYICRNPIGLEVN